MVAFNEQIFEGYSHLFLFGIDDFESDDSVAYERDTAAGSLTIDHLIPNLESFDFLGYTVRGNGVRLSPGTEYSDDNAGLSVVPSSTTLISAAPILTAPLVQARNYTIEKYFDLPGKLTTDGAYLGYKHDFNLETVPTYGMVQFDYNRNRPGFVKAVSWFEVAPMAAEYVSGYEVQTLEARFKVLKAKQLSGDDMGCDREPMFAFGFRWAVDLFTLQRINRTDW